MKSGTIYPIAIRMDKKMKPSKKQLASLICLVSVVFHPISATAASKWEAGWNSKAGVFNATYYEKTRDAYYMLTYSCDKKYKLESVRFSIWSDNYGPESGYGFASQKTVYVTTEDRKPATWGVQPQQAVSELNFSKPNALFHKMLTATHFKVTFYNSAGLPQGYQVPGLKGVKNINDFKKAGCK